MTLNIPSEKRIRTGYLRGHFESTLLSQSQSRPGISHSAILQIANIETFVWASPSTFPPRRNTEANHFLATLTMKNELAPPSFLVHMDKWHGKNAMQLISSVEHTQDGKTMSAATQMIDTIIAITERNYALVPITIDQRGRLGCTAHEFLGMPETLFPPTKPSWNKPSDLSKTNEFAYKTCTFATNSPQHLLHGVTAIWREPSTNTCGDTHHTATPSIYCWLKQSVSLNISIAMARHLINARTEQTNDQRQANRKQHPRDIPPIHESKIPRLPTNFMHLAQCNPIFNEKCHLTITG